MLKINKRITLGCSLLALCCILAGCTPSQSENSTPNYANIPSSNASIHKKLPLTESISSKDIHTKHFYESAKFKFDSYVNSKREDRSAKTKVLRIAQAYAQNKDKGHKYKCYITPVKLIKYTYDDPNGWQNDSFHPHVAEVTVVLINKNTLK